MVSEPNCTFDDVYAIFIRDVYVGSQEMLRLDAAVIELFEIKDFELEVTLS